MKSQSKFVDLRVNGLLCPLSLEGSPVFSWRYESQEKNFRQKGFSLSLWDEDHHLLFETSFIASDEQRYALTKPLPRDAYYFWQVRSESESGEICLSPESSFSLGLPPCLLGDPRFGKMIASPLLAFLPHELLSFEAEITFKKTPARRLDFCFGRHDFRYGDRRFNRYHQQIDGQIRLSLDFTEPEKGVGFALIRHAYSPEDRQKENGDSALYETRLGPLQEDNVLHFACDSNFFIHFNRLSFNGMPAEFPPEDKDGINYNPSGLWLVESVAPYLDDVSFSSEGGKTLISRLLIQGLGEKNTILFDSDVPEHKAFFAGHQGYRLLQEGVEVSGAGDALDLSRGSCPYFRKEFVLEKPVKRATLFVSAWGCYSLYLNGKELGADTFLKPGDAVYYDHLPYDSYDVTSDLSTSRNAIGFVLSSGWWNDRMAGKSDFFGDRPGVAALLEIVYQDGTRRTMKTDESWKCFGDGPLRYAAIYNGTVFDARKEKNVAGFSQVGFDDRAWVSAIPARPRMQAFAQPKLIGKEAEGVRALETLNPSYHGQIKRGDSRGYLFDFHTNFGGLVRFHLPALPQGTLVFFRYGEDLYPEKKAGSHFDYGEAAGELYTDNLRAAVATDFFVSAGKAIDYLPPFTYHGFRYAEINFRGLSEDQEKAVVEQARLEGLVLSSYPQKSLTIQTSDPAVNQLIENIQRTAAANHMSIPTDCPQRDEREGWEGDFAVFCQSDLYLSDLGPFFTHYERMLSANAKHYRNGSFGNITPTNDYGEELSLAYDENDRAGPIGWALAGLNAPYYLFRQTGDASLALVYWESLTRFIHAYRNSLLPSKKVLIETGDYIHFDYCDWLAPKETDKTYVNNCFYLHALSLMAVLAGILKKKEEEQNYSRLFEDGKKEFRETFISAGRPCDQKGKILTSETAYCLPLDFDLLEEKEKASFLALFLSALQANGYSMNTGFLGTPSLLFALSKNGHLEEAMKLFLCHQCPSWLYEVDQGATSMWERWDSFSKENGYQDVSMNSFSHYAFGAVIAFFIEDVAGIRPGENGFRNFILQPGFTDRLPQVKARYLSENGMVESGLDPMTYQCVIPANCSADLYLPLSFVSAEMTPAKGEVIHQGKKCHCFHLGSGSHVFKKVG